MPNIIKLSSLQRADILLKVIPTENAAFISRAIGFGQRAHIRFFAGGGRHDYIQNLGFDPCSYSHAAFSLGGREIIEFDEGSGIANIMKYRGEGVVYDTPGNRVNRSGNLYTVIRCTNTELAGRAWMKAMSIKSFSMANNSCTYGIRKLVASCLVGKRGTDMDQDKVDKILSKLRGEQTGLMGMRRANMFCSEFVTTCYLWAAQDMTSTGKMASVESLLGTTKTRLSPAELSVRLLTAGANHFQCIGTYKAE